jgi:putative colanic acid biosynthesis acetyltransferase WcaF
MEVLDAAKAGTRRGGPAFPLSNRIRRALWAAAWLLLARWTPPPLHRWRVLVLRLFGARTGRGCQVYGSTIVWYPANLELGDNVMIGPGAILYNQGRIAIGSGSVISQRAHLCASSHRIGDRHFQLVLKPIAIGANCWIAAEAFVGPGVTMAEGAVLAARGALFDDAAADTVYRGNPAMAVATRRYAADADAEA